MNKMINKVKKEIYTKLGLVELFKKGKQIRTKIIFGPFKV